MNKLAWQIEKIIDVAVALEAGSACGASTSECIAGAFVINRMDKLPESYPDVIEAWDRLGGWQEYVRLIKENYMCEIYERVNELPL